MSDDLTAVLEAIRDRHGPVHSSGDDMPRVLAAIEAVLSLHVMQDKPVTSYRGCPAHAFNPETLRFGSLEDVRSCPDCETSQYFACSHCKCPNDAWPCPTIQALTAALAPRNRRAGT